jgi:hypothetical protein
MTHYRIQCKSEKKAQHRQQQKQIRSYRFEFATKTPTLFPGPIFDLDLLLWFFCVLAMRKRQPLSVK